LKIYRRRLKITGRLKFRFWAELERLQSREGAFVAQVAWFGEPWKVALNTITLILILVKIA